MVRSRVVRVSGKTQVRLAKYNENPKFAIEIALTKAELLDKLPPSFIERLVRETSQDL